MSLSATRFPLSHVGTAGNQGPDPAARADPQVGGLLWGSQSGYRPVRTNDVPDLQRCDVPNLPPATAAPTHAQAPHDRRAPQRSLSSRKTPHQLPSSPCSTVAPAVSAALQPATGSDRAVWKLTRRLATHNRYFATLAEVLKAVSACFNRWRKPNTVLHRLCCIT